MPIRYNSITTDNVCLLAMLALDVRPSAVCCYERKGVSGTYDVEVLRSETIGTSFDHLANRFGELLKKSFGGTNMGDIHFELKVVDALTYKFQEQKACELAKNPLVLGE